MKVLIYQCAVRFANFVAVKTNSTTTIFDDVAAFFEPSNNQR